MEGACFSEIPCGAQQNAVCPHGAGIASVPEQRTNTPRRGPLIEEHPCTPGTGRAYPSMPRPIEPSICRGCRFCRIPSITSSNPNSEAARPQVPPCAVSQTSAQDGGENLVAIDQVRSIAAIEFLTVFHFVSSRFVQICPNGWRTIMIGLRPLARCGVSGYSADCR